MRTLLLVLAVSLTACVGVPLWVVNDPHTADPNTTVTATRNGVPVGDAGGGL